MTNIILTGFMGTGKTTIGAALAKARNLRFVDMDQEIEKTENTTIKQRFETQGEAYF